MSPHLYVVTGASRGLGLALAEQLLCANNFVLCISRTSNAGLELRSDELKGRLEQWLMDLEHGVDAAARLGQWLAQQKAVQFASATLINNAALMPQVGPLGSCDPRNLAGSLRINLEAPMLLTASFLRATEKWPMPRRILNISSGLGRRPMASQAAYCAAKAGMDHFTRCMALDEALKAHGAKVCSLAPGVIDTDMQQQLRSADSALFPDHHLFADLRAKGQLASPDATAAGVLAYLARTDFGHNPVADLRDSQP
jgi:NAD(P)-dependent dehydrogenase (short-subunit alcohol dehydrogenase family)